MQMDMKGLDKPCDCGSLKLAGNCCRENEICPCGSGGKVSKCCVWPPIKPSKNPSKK